MYRILAVDDEEPVLDSFEFMLKNAADFELAGKARSGYEALRLIYELEPDIVFMDINIPGMDGLGVIAEVYRKYPAMVFILSTAYERFDLAQRAIPLGVFAYLVKPVSKKTFFSTLDTVREHLETRSQAALPAGPGTEVETERLFLRKTIWKELGDTAWERWRRRLKLPSDKGIVCLLDLDEQGEARAAGIGEKLSLKYRCLFDARQNQGLFFISGDIDRETLEDRFTAILGETFPAGAGHYGIGGLYRGGELYRSCDEALQELQDKRNQSDVQLRERLRIVLLRRKLGLADPEEVRKLFTLLRTDIFACHDFTLAKAKMVSIFMFLIDDINGAYSDGEEPPPFAAAEEIMGLRDAEEWEAWVTGAFEKLLSQAGLVRSGKFPVPLVKAIAFIHEHLTEGVQLSSAADAARVSPAYLSRLFSEHLKTNFIDYVTELRIEKAEKLIRENRMNIKEIAYAVGYQDPNYFSKIFRKLRGLSPTMYGSGGNLPR
ncbi:MAG: helix-turn-helix domain-containing protein [Spirochaetaceae bacterium]|jgi:two-component system response regulator YesN|nr:helix-turn-helix domain-containing protein [Spirochaetaceae bacterium]